MKKYEYKIYDTTLGINPDSEEELNFLGNEGWELVAIRESDSVIKGFHKYYFKREITPTNLGGSDE